MSDKDLNQLINTLKTEAVEAAEAEAEKILTDARQRAQEITTKAETKRRQILTEAESEAQAIVDKGKIALQQAARDLRLSLQQEMLDLFRSVFEAEVRKNFTPDLLRSAILPVLENVGRDAAVELPAELLEEIAMYIRKQLQGAATDIALHPNGQLAEGIKIRKTAEGWSYELSPATVTEALRPHLTEKWVELLNG